LTVRDAFGAAIPFLIVAALVFGPAAAWLASRRLRNPAAWLVLGALLGPVALVLLAIAPAGRCPACGEPTHGFASTCATCGSPLASEQAANEPTEATSPPVAVRTASVASAAAPTERPPAAATTKPTSARASTARGSAARGTSTRASTGRTPATRGRAATAAAAATAPTVSAPSTVPPAAEPPPAPLAAAARGGATTSGPDRLAAVGARRPTPVRDAGYAMAALETARGSSLTILAIGVYVRGTESLVAGSRYLIARTPERLIVIGPVEASSEHVELELPLDEVEATYIPDRLVVSAWTEGRSRRWVLAFQSLAGLTASAIDEALMTTPAPREAIGRA